MEKMKNKEERNVGLDLLRIVAMLLIIWLHSIDHSGVLEAAEQVGRSNIYIYIRFVYMLVQVCVNCYVMITGYFLVKSEFRLKKLFKLWLEVFFYSMFIKIVFMAVAYTPMSITSLISCFIPVLSGRYWFITIYFGLYLISPFLNIAINAMDKQKHLQLNIVLFLLTSVMVSISPAFAGMNSGGGWGLAWFVVLYFLASWIRLYYKPTGNVVGKICGWLLITGIVTIIWLIGDYIPPIKSIADNWYKYDSVPTYFMTILLFLAFVNMNIRNSVLKKIILTIAPCTLGVYLIHAHASFSPWIWEYTNLEQKINSATFPILQIFVVGMIFVGCIGVEYIRKNSIGKIENSKVVDCINEFVLEQINRIVQKIK